MVKRKVWTLDKTCGQNPDIGESVAVYGGLSGRGSPIEIVIIVLMSTQYVGTNMTQ